MGLTKNTRQPLSVAANGPNAKKVVENLPRNSREPVDHWAILDEIEAPMWVDLTLECDSSHEDKDDEWFHISHPFHQCSAQQLLSTLDFQGSSSPNLPVSISKLRGKDLKSRKQEPVVCSFTINKQQPSKSLSSKSSLIEGGSEKEMKNNSFDEKSISSFSGKNSSAKSVVFGGGESASTSTITSEIIEASTQPIALNNGLLLNLRNSLRKSYVTRQASRVEIKGMSSSQSGQKSSSGKSSVGSTENMNETPDSRNVRTISQLPTDNKLNRANVNKAPAARSQNLSYISDSCVDRKASKKMDHEKRKEGHVNRGVTKVVPLTTDNNSWRARGINPSSRTFDGGKENQSRKMALAVKSSMSTKEAKGPLQDPKVVKGKLRQTSNRTKLACQKDNRTAGSKVDKSNRKVGTVYFR